MNRHLAIAAAASLAGLATPCFAQDAEIVSVAGIPLSTEPEKSVFDDNWLAIGFGVQLDTSYDGSNDYVFKPLPIIGGEIAGIQFSPRASGFGIDLVEFDVTPRIGVTLGPVLKLRGDRSGSFEDPVVEAAGELERAIEIGVSTRVSIREVLHTYDRINIGVDVRWDVKGAHSGRTIAPGISYRTPLSRGSIAALSLKAYHADGDFNDYYFTVNEDQSAASGLPLYEADAGWYKAGAKFSLGFALDGDLEDRGFVIGAQVGYQRMLGDGAQTPFTDIRGNRNQFKAATGIGYIF